MLPQEIELKILEYLSIKPMKRCRATNNKGKICKKNAKNGYLICNHHKNILLKKSKNDYIQFIELCIMLRRVISNNKYKGYWYCDNYNAWWSQSCPLYV